LRIIGFIIALVYWNSLEYQFSGHGLFMLCVGIVMMYPAIITTGINYVKK
jgi:hypothetical protein